jgi:hypothetical protein
MKEQLISRYGYKNTSSMAGRGEHVEFYPSDVVRAACWFNVYGNPSYCLYFEDGSTLYCVDDYGCMNGLPVSRVLVQRKKDLFRG